tara:strand:- start:379 stop:660 length:282 start_codon:yes stop_codon:yes gene_type:complete
MEKPGTLSEREASKLYELQIGLSDGKYKTLSNSVMHRLANLCPRKITMWIYLLHHSDKSALDPSLVEIMNAADSYADAAREICECGYTLTKGY